MDNLNLIAIVQHLRGVSRFAGPVRNHVRMLEDSVDIDTPLIIMLGVRRIGISICASAIGGTAVWRGVSGLGQKICQCLSLAQLVSVCAGHQAAGIFQLAVRNPQVIVIGERQRHTDAVPFGLQAADAVPERVDNVKKPVYLRFGHAVRNRICGDVRKSGIARCFQRVPAFCIVPLVFRVAVGKRADHLDVRFRIGELAQRENVLPALLQSIRFIVCGLLIEASIDGGCIAFFIKQRVQILLRSRSCRTEIFSTGFCVLRQIALAALIGLQRLVEVGCV